MLPDGCNAVKTGRPVFFVLRDIKRKTKTQERYYHQRNKEKKYLIRLITATFTTYWRRMGSY
jgi:hypothetical protein